MPDADTPETAETQVNELLALAEQLQQQVEQLQAANSQLAAANVDLLQQIEQYADPLLSFGAGVHRAVLNARSIRGMSLTEQKEVDEHGLTHPRGKYAMTIDELRVSEYLPPDQAERELAQAEEIWRQALQPPE